MEELTSQQRASKKQAQQRKKSSKYFSAILLGKLSDQQVVEETAFIERVIKVHGGTRKEALISAFRALSTEQNVSVESNGDKTPSVT